jgi:hypothetical protein
MSTLLHAIVYVFLHIFPNALFQFANKMGLQQKIVYIARCLENKDTSQHVSVLESRVLDFVTADACLKS